MKNNLTKTLIISLTLVLFVSVAAAVFCPDKVETAVAAANVYTAEQYTEDDRLLNEDGTLSDKDIRQFAQEVNAAAPLNAIDDIMGVIPRQYLESEEEECVFSFMGREYGFYMEKIDDTFDVLLIDFSFNTNDNDTGEFYMRIEPIMS